ncbi:MAG TPA: tetratricopeptide repeat protein [Casimicrobiaceae bacterium]|nr:tetratricopeptide repeat protein [Casimicrobiaceae bacterium]
MISEQRSNPPTPPSGTVTFLFTDIEGSTRLWAIHHDAMRTSLARHDALLRQAIAAHGGHVFKTGGDAFCAAFATAAGAVEAALAAQRALRAERWPEHAAILARMALHTGAAEIRDGDYFGTPLNHVARLLAVGHGGQTLLSEITHDLCRDRMPAEMTLKSLGEHSLKDLARRETVFQLCHPELPQAFPPLKTLLTPIDAGTPSIAVLPFADLSAEKDQEYFTDGLAEELLNVLSKIRGLRVASRTSAFHFKGKDVDIPTIAQKLNVATVLEGSVRKSGKRVRITAQLIQAATDSHLWSDTYDRELEDIFAVQDDIAQSVVKELRSALLGEKPDASANAAVKAEVHAAGKGRGENAEAYRLYLHGRFFEDRFTREDTAKAVGYYRQALELDPDYALAWAGLSRAHSNQAGYSWDVEITKGFGRARKAVERALQLEPDLAEGHAALGQILRLHDWDWKGADESFRRALELAPGNAQVLRDAGNLAGNLGRPAEALALLRRSAALDPLSATAHRSVARLSYFADLFDEAEAAGQKALELNPQGGLTHYWLGLVRLQRGRLDEAQEMFEREPHDTFRLLGLSQLHHARGQSAESEAALRELIEKDAAGAAYQIALGYASRGEMDPAFEWLERAYVQRDPGLGMMKISQPLRKLREDPRWQPFLEKMGLAR